MDILKSVSAWSVGFGLIIMSSVTWAQNLGPMPPFRHAVDLLDFEHPENRELNQIFRGCVEVARSGLNSCEAASLQAHAAAVGGVHQASGVLGQGPSMGTAAIAMAGASARGASAIGPAIDVCIEVQQTCERVCARAATRLEEGVKWVEEQLQLARQFPHIEAQRPVLEHDYTVGYPAKTNAQMLVGECSNRFAERVAALEATRASLTQAGQQATVVGQTVGEHDAETADLIARLRPRAPGQAVQPTPPAARAATPRPAVTATRGARQPAAATTPRQGVESDEQIMQRLRSLTVQGSGPRCSQTRGVGCGGGAAR